jgi:hypothetical protein
MDTFMPSGSGGRPARNAALVVDAAMLLLLRDSLASAGMQRETKRGQN